MASKLKQYYDIKFPFTANNNEELFIDLNTSMDAKVASQIAHVLLTRVGTRLRMPEFGTNLITYIFEQNDELTWNSVEQELRKKVSTYVPNANIEKIAVIQGTDKDEESIYVDVMYSVKVANEKNNYRMALKII